MVQIYYDIFFSSAIYVLLSLSLAFFPSFSLSEEKIFLSKEEQTQMKNGKNERKKIFSFDQFHDTS